MIKKIRLDRPLIYDWYCGGGGASVGYWRAGFDVVGIDLEPMKNYPFYFIRGNALKLLPRLAHQSDGNVGSPPCKFGTTFNKLWGREYYNYIPETRQAFIEAKKPYIIENVPGAKEHLIKPAMLCGTMFPGLWVQRHRLFEANFTLKVDMTCKHLYKVAKHGRPAKPYQEYAAVSGHLPGMEYAKIAMGIDWMNQFDLSQAIPPAYTFYLGQQMLKHMGYDPEQLSRVKSDVAIHTT